MVYMDQILIVVNAWLEYMCHELHVQIHHTRNGSKYYVDGYNEDSKICFEFNSCEFHGHTCVKSDRYKKIYHGRSLNDLFEATEVKKKIIEIFFYLTYQLRCVKR